MTSYGDAHTGRIVITYTVLGKTHRVKFRKIASMTEADFLTTVEGLATAWSPALPAGQFIWGSAKYAAAGSTTYASVPFSPAAPTGPSTDPTQTTSAYFWEINAPDEGAGRLSFRLHTTRSLLDEDMRIRLGRTGDFDDFLNVYNSNSDSIAGSTGAAGTRVTYASAGIAKNDLKKVRG